MIPDVWCETLGRIRALEDRLNAIDAGEPKTEKSTTPTCGSIREMLLSQNECLQFILKSLLDMDERLKELEMFAQRKERDQ